MIFQKKPKTTRRTLKPATPLLVYSRKLNWLQFSLKGILGNLQNASFTFRGAKNPRQKVHGEKLLEFKILTAIYEAEEKMNSALHHLSQLRELQKTERNCNGT